MAIVAAAGAFLSFNACSSDDTPAPTPTPDGGDPSEASAPPSDAGEGDADAAGDADAGAQTCTSEGFCTIPVPAGQALRGVWGDGTGVAWAVSREGAVLRWDGKAWTVHSSFKGALVAIWGSGPTDIWIGGVGGLLHGQGPTSEQITFTALPYDRPFPILSIQGFGPNDVWATGGRFDWGEQVEEGVVLHYKGPTGNPATDLEVDPVSSRQTMFTTVWGSGPDDVWLAGTTILGQPQGLLLLNGHSNGSGGTTFEEVPIQNSEWGTEIWSIAGGVHVPEHFIVGGDPFGSGLVWTGPRHPSDAGDAGGRIWDSSIFSGYVLRAIWGTSSSDVWAVGDRGRVRHWDGTRWRLPRVSSDKFPVIEDLYGIWGKGSEDMWIVGDGIALRRGPKSGGQK